MGSTDFGTQMAGVRDAMVEMASLVLSQVEQAVDAWETHDPDLAGRVMAQDEAVDDRLLDLDLRIYELHLVHAPLAGDLRLLHVGLITAVALERVGDLAVSISRLAESVPVGVAVPHIAAIIRRMSARAVDSLARGVQAIARVDADLGDEARIEADTVRLMLEDVRAAASNETEQGDREWITASVLVARHLERVANNAAELGGRVRFIATGEPFVRNPRPPG
jgi:phosphate transport system protein